MDDIDFAAKQMANTIREDQFVKRVFTKLPTIPEEDDRRAVREAAIGLFHEKWTENDAVEFLRCLEHVNPLLDEQVALARMSKIRARVLGEQYWHGKTCQETTGMIGEKYLRCGKPAVALIQHRGRSEGPYYMCGPDANHNVYNRNAVAIVVKPGEERWVNR